MDLWLDGESHSVYIESCPTCLVLIPTDARSAHLDWHRRQEVQR